MLKADTVTLKAALVAPAATFTEAGGCSALLLLESVTTVWLVAAALRYTEHCIHVGPVKVCVAHESLLNVATGADVAGLSVIASICDTPLAVAVSVTVCLVLMADAVTLKAALVAPAATFTEAGGCSALLLLESVTTVWLVAAALRYTEHAVVAGPVNVCVAHESLLNVATGADGGVVVVAGSSVIESICETPFAVAVNRAVCLLLRADAFTLNDALVAPTATSTETGACNALLLLESFTTVWLVAPR